MPLSHLSQALQISASASYNDVIASPHTVGVAEGQTVLEGDMNIMRTLLKKLLGTTNWYDESEMTIQGIADKYFITRITPAGYDNQASGTGTSTTGFDTATKTITGHNNGAGDSTTGGVIVDSTKAYRIAIRDASTKNPIDDGAGNEVYGRISWSGTQYVINWYSYVSGTETAYTFASSINIDVAFAGVSRRYEDLDWNQFLDPSWHDIAGLSGSLDDSNVVTGPWTYMLTGLTTQQQVNNLLDNLGNTANGEGASRISIEDASTWFAGTDIEGALNEIETLFGSTTSTTYNFSQDNVLADNDYVYPALNKLDIKWGDLAAITTGKGAALVGSEDAGGFYAGADVEAILQEIGQKIEDVSGWDKVWETTPSPIGSGVNHTLPFSKTYTMASGAHMDVYLDGQLLVEGAANDYQEISVTQIAFNQTIPTGKNITYMIRK